MLSITAVLGYHEFGLSIWLGAQGGSEISAGRDDFQGSSAGLSTLSEGWESELSEFEAENAMLNCDYTPKVVEIVIGGIPTVLDIRFVFLFVSLGRIQLQGSVWENLFDLERHQVDHQKVEVGI
jgi:hypothetical protein